MLVRRRVGHDLPGSVRALREVHEADGYPARWPADPAAWLTPSGTVDCWVAEVTGVVVGHACLVGGVVDGVVSRLTGAPADGLGAVSRLYVAPQGRGRGLGAGLLGAVTTGATERGLQVVLDVVEGSGAVRLYERLGWRLVDRRSADWTTPSGARPSIRVYLPPPPG
ncbi:GNAT family N-acetyltransferase [Modestobacter sp. VKM Ac-2984]|uniref:GNAT family N-acetyltransferase n=1 Tax=Modestobacter sp. VKM Ac-2984 TaxID=3004138 RepID=UPI0022AB27C7|nr:GNAT family N-acetyltransferase [Modestobacter sp. VKM Ac-2984]MCZ2816753.1 GNAT family N-acetyltransferase [Modestobacter sp. VKM Ac-2984]